MNISDADIETLAVNITAMLNDAKRNADDRTVTIAAAVILAGSWIAAEVANSHGFVGDDIAEKLTLEEAADKAAALFNRERARHA